MSKGNSPDDWVGATSVDDVRRIQAASSVEVGAVNGVCPGELLWYENDDIDEADVSWRCRRDHGLLIKLVSEVYPPAEPPG